jgi:hypothetical protein
VQLEIVQYLVELGADINAQDSFRHTSLNDAVRHRYHFVFPIQPNFCEILIYLQLFFLFCWIRHDEVSKYLCGRGATLVLDEFEAGVRMCQVQLGQHFIGKLVFL